jgi:hypothetical protein
MKIKKEAQHVKENQYPSVEDLASYVDSIKLYLSDNQVKDEELKQRILDLPSPQNIRKRLSEEEVKILFQTIGYIWKKITGHSIIEDSKVEQKPDILCGNYWMLQKGILLYGVNHYTIIKQNLDLFRSLLGINAFALHEKMASEPNALIKLVLDHGGMRIFVSKDKRAYFQMADDTYGKWGKRKAKRYDFPKKIIKVIDKTAPYKGWKSGITVIL